MLFLNSLSLFQFAYLAIACLQAVSKSKLLDIFAAHEYVNNLAPGNLLANCSYYDSAMLDS